MCKWVLFVVVYSTNTCVVVRRERARRARAGAGRRGHASAGARSRVIILPPPAIAATVKLQYLRLPYTMVCLQLIRVNHWSLTYRELITPRPCCRCSLCCTHITLVWLLVALVNHTALPVYVKFQINFGSSICVLDGYIIKQVPTYLQKIQSRYIGLG